MLVLAAGLAASLVAGGAVRIEERKVVKSRVYLVKEPSFLATQASRTLQRGESIQVELPGRGSWLVARKDRERGYIHLSYVSRPPGQFTVSASTPGAAKKMESMTSDEVSMAVGHFCEAVERTWRSENPDMEVGFQRLESFMPSAPEESEPSLPEPEAVAAFAAEGRLRMPLPPEAELAPAAEPPASSSPGGEP